MYTPAAKKLRKTTVSHDIAPHSTTLTGNSGPVSVFFVTGELTGKERDPETSLYYYGARYLDPRTSRWLSVDPAMGEYIPRPGQEPDKLTGIGGIFNYVNFHVYHYAGNNPVKLKDSEGRQSEWDLFMEAYNNGEIVTAVDAWSAVLNDIGRKADIFFRNFGYINSETARLAVFGGLKFMSEHGDIIALACYQTGNVKLGMIVNGVVIAADITMAATEYKETGDWAKFSSDLLRIAVAEATSHATGNYLQTERGMAEMADLVGSFTTIQGSAIRRILNMSPTSGASIEPANSGRPGAPPSPVTPSQQTWGRQDSGPGPVTLMD